MVATLCGVTRSTTAIAQCRASLGEAPRSFSWFDKFRYLRIPRSDWVEREDPLAEILKAQDLLLAEGRLVWGALVQANSDLFVRGWHDLPAAVIYSPDTSVFDDSPDLLLDIARKLYQLKGPGSEIRILTRSRACLPARWTGRCGWRSRGGSPAVPPSTAPTSSSPAGTFPAGR